MKTLTILLFLTVITNTMHAQTLSPGEDIIRWNIDRFEDVNSHVTENVSSWVITDHLSGIRWVQSNGDYVMNFDVTSTTGTWNDVDQQGFIQYNVTLDGRAGNLRIERTVTGTTITLTFLEGSTNTLPFVLHVSTIEEN